MQIQTDYNKPLTEAEPYLVQNKALGNYSSIQTGTDWYGNPITEPDRSNPTRNRFESPLQTIMSFEYAIAKGENELLAPRPSGSVTNPGYSYAEPSRRTSAYSGTWSTPGPRAQYRPGYPRDRESYGPTESYARDPREPPQAESSGASSYDQQNHPQQQFSQQEEYYRSYSQEYSPPTTPTRAGGGNQQVTYPQQLITGYPSPEQDVEYPRVPPKPPVHNFLAKPATPPGSDVSQEKKKGKMSKLKRFSGLGKSKA